jgi:hypothetical protein
LPGARTGLRSALAPGVVRKTNLAGDAADGHYIPPQG